MSVAQCHPRLNATALQTCCTGCCVCSQRIIAELKRVTSQHGVQGKVVFVAPTKPLVNQQIEACYEFMGVSKVVSVARADVKHCVWT